PVWSPTVRGRLGAGSARRQRSGSERNSEHSRRAAEGVTEQGRMCCGHAVRQEVCSWHWRKLLTERSGLPHRKQFHWSLGWGRNVSPGGRKHWLQARRPGNGFPSAGHEPQRRGLLAEE